LALFVRPEAAGRLVHYAVYRRHTRLYGELGRPVYYLQTTKCLKFGHRLTLCTLKIYLVTT